MSGGHIDPESQVVLFLVINFVIGFICYEINKRTNIPYTPMLVVCGLLLRGSKIFWDQFSIVEKMNPHSILIIFIPLLIFESAFGSRVDLLGKYKYQIFLIAVPGTIIIIFMLGFSLKMIIGYEDEDLNWYQALMLSTILSTTDPVAVVAILKSLGAPIHIQSLIEMESLFNDAPAIVFFTILAPAAAGEEISTTQAVKDAFSLSLGGVGIGIAFSYGVIFVIKFLMKGVSSGYINIAIISAYSLFFVCECYNLRVSGLVALVFLGVNFNRTMKDQFENHFEEQIHTCVQLIETILFFLSGVFIGSIFFGTDESKIVPLDWVRLFVYYICLVCSRGIVMMILYYPLKHSGEGFDMKKAAVATWGGLRGALSIALVLIGNIDKRIPERSRDLMLFNVVGVAFLTLVINAPTFGFLINILKIKDIKDERTQFKGQVLHELQNQSKKILEALKYDSSYKLVEWQGAEALIEMDKLEQEIQKLDTNLKESFQKFLGKDQTTLNKEAYEHKILQIARYHVIRIISRKVKEIQNRAWISNSIFDKIFESLEILSEQTFSPINLWTHLDQHIIPFEILSLLIRFEKTPLIGSFFRVYVHFKLEIIYEMSFIIQIALQSTVKALKEAQDIPQQLKELPHIQQQIVEELLQQLGQAKYMVEETSMKFWSVVGKLQQRKAAQNVLVRQSKIIDEFIESTYVPEKEGTELKNQLAKKIEKLSSFYSYYQLTTKEDSIFRSAFKNYFSDEEFQGLLLNSRDCVFQPQQYITQYGQLEEYIYVITHGKIEKTLYPVDNGQNSDARKSFFETSLIFAEDKESESPGKPSSYYSPEKSMNMIHERSLYNNQPSLNLLPQVSMNFIQQNSMNYLPNSYCDSPLKYNNSPKKSMTEKKDKKVEFIEFGNDNFQGRINNTMLFGIGSMTGVVNVFGDKKESLVDIRALEVTSCKKISITYLREVFNKNLKFQEYCYKRNLYQFFYMYPSKFGMKLIQLGEEVINKLSIQSDYIHVKGDQNEEEETIVCKYGGFIFSGRLFTVGQKQIYEEWSTIPCSKTPLIPMAETKMIVFKPTSKSLKKLLVEASEIVREFSLDQPNPYITQNNIKDDLSNIKDDEDEDDNQLKDFSLNQITMKNQNEYFQKANTNKFELKTKKVRQGLSSQQEVH